MTNLYFNIDNSFNIRSRLCFIIDRILYINDLMNIVTQKKM